MKTGALKRLRALRVARTPYRKSNGSCGATGGRGPARVSGVADERGAESALETARHKAEQLGVLQLGELRTTNILKPVVDDPPMVAWVTGTELTRLPKPLRALVGPRSGWAADGWSDYLRWRAASCDDQHADVAHLYEQAAAMMAETANPSPENS